MALTGTVNMFRTPASPKMINEAPVKLGTDTYNMYRDPVTYAPFELYYIPVGQKIHLPNVTVDGGKAYYGGKEINLWLVSARTGNGPPIGVEFNTVVVTDLSTSPWQLGTDANGAYVELIAEYQHNNSWYSSTFVSAESYIAMVYPDNNYSAYPFGSPAPTYYSSPIL